MRSESYLAIFGHLYLSVETWMYPNLVINMKELWDDSRLFFYWRFLKHLPLLWGRVPVLPLTEGDKGEM